MGIFQIFGTSLRAINSYAGAMGILANNIANSSNEYYSRQRVRFEALSPDTLGGIETGRGVNLASVSQVVDAFIETRLNTNLQKSGNYEAQSTYLKIAESTFNEIEGNGLNSMMANFFNAFTALSAEPENSAIRSNVLTSARNVTDRFNEYGSRLNKLRETIDLEIDGIVPAINDLLESVKELNLQIREVGSDAMTFKDERRRVLNEIANYIDINVIDVGNTGEVQVYTKAGNPLVNGVNVATLSTLQDATNNNLLDIYVTMGQTTSNITSTLQEGRLSGLLDVRDNKITDYKDKLDELAYQFATEVNNIHTTGFDLSGNTGNFFFGNLATATDAAALIQLDVDVLDKPNAIAIASAIADLPGGNDLALDLADLADSTTIGFASGNNSFSGFYGDFLAGIGNDSALALNLVGFQDNVVHQIKLDRDQVSGVNVDEEQIDLAKYQAAYEASGRLIRVADTIIQTLMDALG